MYMAASWLPPCNSYAPPMPTPALAARVAAAYVEGIRQRALAVEGGEVLQVDGLEVALTNLPAPELNAAVVLQPPRDPAAALAQAEALFRSRGHSFFGLDLEAGRHPAVEAAAHAAGLVRVHSRPVMAVSLAALPEAPVPDGMRIDLVRSERDLDALRSIEVGVFQAKPVVTERFLGPRLLASEVARLFVARLDGEPVGEGAAWLLAGTAGVFGIGVLERARERRLGAALTITAARAFGDAADLAWLLPSDMARSLYERLGFRAVSDWAIWIRPGR